MNTPSSSLKPLRDYQIGDLAWYIANPKTANLSDPATGKTPSTLVYAEYLWRKKGAKTIFTMPLNLFRQNRQKFFDFTNFTEDEVVIVEGTPKQREKIISNPNAKVFIGSFNFFKSAKPGQPSNFDLVKKYHKPQTWASFVDEFHLGYKSITAQRTIMWLHAVHHEMYSCLMLTGTAIDGRLDTAFPIIHAIEPRYYAGYQDFLNQHAIFDFWGKPSAWQNTDKVKVILQRHTIRRTFEQVYGKENKVIIHDPVEMGEDMRKYYQLVDAKARQRLAQLEASPSEQVNAEDFESAQAAVEFRFLQQDLEMNPAVALLRARQIMQDPEALKLKFTDLGKDERTVTHAMAAYEANKKFCVFAVFPGEVERLANRLEKEGLKVGRLHGQISPRKRDEVDALFKAGKLDGVVATQQTTGVGLDWEFVDTMIFVSMDYRDSAFVQSYRRAVRGVREKPLLIYVLEYENSVDQPIFGMVDRKMRLAKDVQPDKEHIQIKKADKASTISASKFIGGNPNPSAPPRAPGKKLGFGAIINT